MQRAAALAELGLGPPIGAPLPSPGLPMPSLARSLLAQGPARHGWALQHAGWRGLASSGGLLSAEQPQQPGGQQEQQQQQQQEGEEERRKQAAAAAAAAADLLRRETVWSLPNMLSLGRAASGPPIAALILHGDFEVAAVAVTLSGVSEAARQPGARWPGRRPAGCWRRGMGKALLWARNMHPTPPPPPPRAGTPPSPPLCPDPGPPPRATRS
jgi:hypothetical protein